MKRLLILTAILAGSTTATVVMAPAEVQADVPQLINLQGVLQDSGGVPVTTIQSVLFNFWNASSGGTSLWSETQNVSPDANGLFSTALGTVSPIPDSAFWGTNLYLGIKVGADPEMTPRQRIVATGYAFSDAWGKLNTARGINAIAGGGSSNSASGLGSTVGGGTNNSAVSNYSTVGGGENNTGSALHATVGGGEGNTVSSTWSTVGGGFNNTVSGPQATVSGGEFNTASARHAAVGGGTSNTASGGGGTIPGGKSNTAAGIHSFAAGRQAKAMHQGAFVWADDTPADFSSTGANQFLVRAAGGIWLGTTSAPSIPGTDFLNTSTGAHLTAGGAWTNSSDANKKENFTPVDRRELLEKIASLPISHWNYRDEHHKVRHIGPVAQDFYALFGVGSDDKSISTIDPAGIALAAIQELYKRNQELHAANEELLRRMKRLEQR